MGDTIGAAFGILFMFYLIACGVAVPLWAYGQWQAGRECAAAHDVYSCERAETWVPRATPHREGE